MAGEFVFIAVITKFLIGRCGSSSWKAMADIKNVDKKLGPRYDNLTREELILISLYPSLTI